MPSVAYYNWGMSVPFMAKKGINFTQIFEYCRNDQQKELSKKAPVHEVLLDMAVDKLPSPSRPRSTGYPTSGRATWSPSRGSP